MGISVYIAHVLTTPAESPITFDKKNIGERVADVVFRSKDGVQLAGWYFRGVNDKAIIFVHGAGNNNRVHEVYGTPEIAKHFYDLGYTVLLFDLRGNGESQKARLGLGLFESNDVAGAFEYLVAQEFKPESIGIISTSMGAIATVLAYDSVKSAGGIVLDSSATEVREITSKIMIEDHNVPKIIHPGTFLAAKLFFGLDIDKIRPIDKIQMLKNTPLLILHGGNDSLIPPDHAKKLSEKAGSNAKLIIFPKSEHVETYVKNKEQYLELVTNFFEDNLKE